MNNVVPTSAAFLRIGTTLTCLVIASPAARAQAINQYFPPIGSGVGGSAAETSLLDALQGFTPPPIMLHDFAISGDAGETIGFNRNVDGLPGGASSAVIDTTAALSARSQWSRNELDGAITVADTRYTARSQQDHTDWTANLGGIYELGQDRLGIAYTHLNLVQLPTDLGALATSQRIPYQVDEAAITYTASTGSPLSLIPGADITHYQFQDPDAAQAIDPAGGIDNQSQGYRDRSVINETLTARYAVSQDNDLILVGRGTEIRYQHGLAGVPSRDSDGFAILAGASVRDDGPIEYRAVVGYQERRYPGGGYGTIRSPIAQAELAWLPTRLTTISATVTNGIEDGAFENVVGFTATTATLQVQHAYARNITLTAHVDIQHASYPSTPRFLSNTLLDEGEADQTSYGAGLALDWLVNRHLRLGATYDLSNQNAVAGSRFTIHEALLSLHFIL